MERLDKDPFEWPFIGWVGISLHSDTYPLGYIIWCDYRPQENTNTAKGQPITRLVLLSKALIYILVTTYVSAFNARKVYPFWSFHAKIRSTIGRFRCKLQEYFIWQVRPSMSNNTGFLQGRYVLGLHCKIQPDQYLNLSRRYISQFNSFLMDSLWRSN